jgi:hypothetical protein
VAIPLAFHAERVTGRTSCVLAAVVVLAMVCAFEIDTLRVVPVEMLLRSVLHNERVLE